jgi:hypothetical protein
VFGIGLFTRLIPKLPFVDCYRAKQIEMELADTNFYHFDGEPGKLTIPATISIEIEKLRIIGVSGVINAFCFECSKTIRALEALMIC